MNLDSKVEQAFQAILNGVSARVVTSIEETERIPPYVSIASEGGPEEPPHTGNQTVQVIVSVYTEFDPEIEYEESTPKANHLNLVEEVENLLLDSNLKDNLNIVNTPDLTVMNAWRDSTTDGQENEDRHLITVMTFNVYAGQF